jgi:hypothetical protein
MAVYAVKYNPSGAYIPGATQVGTLAVAIGDVDYSTGGWVAGVPDDNGYVIYSDTSSLNLVGRTTAGFSANLAQHNKPTFYRSKFKTDSSLLQLINRIPGNTQSFNDINSAKAWLNNAAHVNILGGTYSSGGGTSSPGWLFYSGEGSLDANPPLNIGNAIFVITSSVETFDPNKVNGKALYFNRYDSNGVDYATQFTSLQTNGGTLSITQNGNTATYTTANPNMFVFNNTSNGFLLVNTGMLTQTAAVINPFVYGDPITLSFS